MLLLQPATGCKAHMCMPYISTMALIEAILANSLSLDLARRWYLVPWLGRWLTEREFTCCCQSHLWDQAPIKPAALTQCYINIIAHIGRSTRPFHTRG